MPRLWESPGIQEAVLTRTVRAQPHALLDTTAMGALVVLGEVQLGVGRPDILLLNLDLHTLALRRAAKLRLANLTEARALGARMSGDMAGVGVSARHARQLLGHLSAIGWLTTRCRGWCGTRCSSRPRSKTGEPVYGN